MKPSFWVGYDLRNWLVSFLFSKSGGRGYVLKTYLSHICQTRAVTRPPVLAMTLRILNMQTDWHYLLCHVLWQSVKRNSRLREWICWQDAWCFMLYKQNAFPSTNQYIELILNIDVSRDTLKLLK